MANIASQKRRIRRSRRERLENLHYTSAIKTHFTRLKDAVSANDSSRVETEHRALVRLIDKAAKTGALHRNTAARKKSKAAKLRRSAAA